MFKTYNLTDTQIRQLANVFYLEQGNAKGVAACASHCLNYYEKYQKSKYKNPYDCVLYSGWWSNEASVRQRMSSNSAPTSCIEATGDVILRGNRTLPSYVDEYDWLYDITSATNNGVAFDPLDRSKYKKDITKVKNRFGSSWTFYCFPDGVNGNCDPFGYISKPAGSTSNMPIQNGTVITTAVTRNTSYKLEPVSAGSASASVIILQSILFAEGYTGLNGKPVAVDGEAGGNTIYALAHFQEACGLTPDGVCGTKTWNKIIKGLTV
ncbi:MAG: peptidoglycan-binding protein [Oribacterium sp.]|nr:peptidoglycan-binding protein [Oribacterium sp.]